MTILWCVIARRGVIQQDEVLACQVGFHCAKHDLNLPNRRLAWQG